MPYATPEQITDRYGEEALLLLADRDGDGQVDAEVLEQALADATAEIDAYLAAKYELPLAKTPEVLVRLCVDIAAYRLASDADTGTEERRKRYEDVVKLLGRIAKGEVRLGRADPSSADGASVESPERIFNRKTLQGY